MGAYRIMTSKAGPLKEKIDRIEKTLAEGKGKLEPHRARGLKKRLKRAQRGRRKLLRAEARVKELSAKAAGKSKPEETPASA